MAYRKVFTEKELWDWIFRISTMCGGMPLKDEWDAKAKEIRIRTRQPVPSADTLQKRLGGFNAIRKRLGEPSRNGFAQDAEAQAKAQANRRQAHVKEWSPFGWTPATQR